MQHEAKLLAQKNNQLQSDLEFCESASMGVLKQLDARNIEIKNLQKIFNEHAAILASNSKQILDLNQAKNDVEAEFAKLQTTKEKELRDLNQENKDIKNQLLKIESEYSEKLAKTSQKLAAICPSCELE